MAVLAAVPVRIPATAAGCGRAAAAKAGRWFVAAPPLPAHSATYQTIHGDLRRIRAVAVDPADARVVLVTDGERVQRSDDGGCTWRQVYQVPASPSDANPYADVDQIAGIDAVRIGGRTRVLLVVRPTGWGPTVGGRTYVVRSADGRTGWTTDIDGPPFGLDDPASGGSPPVLHSTPAGMTYLASASPIGTVSYSRTSDGVSWLRRGPTASPDDPVAINGFAVSPYDRDELWEWGGTRSRSGASLTGLRHSRDGGTSWQSVDPWPFFGPNPPTWHSVDVAWPRRGAPARLLALGATRDPTSPEGPPTLSWSGDGGRTFRQVLPPGRASVLDAAIVHTATGDAVVATPSGATYLVPFRGRVPRPGDWRALAPAPVKADAEWTAMGYDRARATATTPGVVALPTWARVELLTVRR